ncbi:hypothetical protein KM043_007631 [Ampulex compressa]|nr:hypothetical protein KM043_007631 [Ampulex compressa]
MCMIVSQLFHKGTLQRQEKSREKPISSARASPLSIFQPSNRPFVQIHVALPDDFELTTEWSKWDAFSAESSSTVSEEAPRKPQFLRDPQDASDMSKCLHCEKYLPGKFSLERHLRYCPSSIRLPYYRPVNTRSDYCADCRAEGREIRLTRHRRQEYSKLNKCFQCGKANQPESAS